MAKGCTYNYKGNTYTEDQIKPIVAYHYAVEDKLLESPNFQKVGKVLQTVTQPNIEIKEGVDFVFEQTPELAQIGTPEQYSQYLDTIFPNSKIKDIVYHGTEKFIGDVFTKEYLGKKSFRPRKREGFYFTNKEGISIIGYAKKTVIPSLINIQNPQLAKDIRDIKEYDVNNDGAISKEDIGDEFETYEFPTFVAFEPEQIHILGSKKDIEGFKEFVSNQTLKPNTSKEVLQEIQSVNEQYGLGNEIVTVEESTGIVDINVNPIAGDLIADIASTSPADKVQSMHINLENESEETLAMFEQKAKQMSERFNYLGITTHVIMDGDLKASGELLGTDSKRYKELVETGNITEGDAVIVVNPKMIFNDTILHEYAHLFIDLVGGMNNPRIKYAYSKIINSPLADKVRQDNPELSGDMLAKEIMATAIGKEATEIFEGTATEPDVSFIQKFINWLRDSVRGLLGLSTSTIKDLSNELLGKDFDTNELQYGGLSTYSQFLKGTKEQREARKLNNKVMTGTKDALDKIKKRIESSLLLVANSQDQNKIGFKETLKKVQADLIQFGKDSDLAAIASFVNNIRERADKVNKVLGDAQDQVNAGQRPVLSFEQLNMIDQFVNTFDVVKDVHSSIQSKYFDKAFKDTGFTDEETEAYKNEILNLKNTFESIENARIKVGRVHLSYRLADYSNKVIVTRRLELEDEFKEANPKQTNESTKQYSDRIRNMVNEQISKELPQLKQEEQQLLLDRLEAAPHDIGSFAMWVSSEKDLNSMVIQLASKLLDEADLKKDQAMIQKKLEALAVWQEFDKETSGTDAKDKYKGLYVEASDGNVYIAGEYDPEWYIQRSKLLSDLINAEDDPIARETAKAKLQEFDQINTDVYTEANYMLNKPKDKWKNKEYANIMSKPESGKAKMLQYLIKSSQDNHKLLHGNASLIKGFSNSNAQFIQAPRIGKNFFEKLVGGNYLQNIKDSAERLVKVKTDEAEFVGQTDNIIEDEQLGMRVLADVKGNLRHGVPIHYRGKLEKDVMSYDLMSSMLLDSYMALNYHHKSSLQTELELMKDVVSKKQFDQTSGFGKKTLMNAIFKKGDVKVEPIEGEKSNELRVLKSIIENRLYGIKNADAANMSKLAGTLMSFSATNMLAFNLPSALVNVMQGKLFNFMEGVADQYFNNKNVINGDRLFWRDIQGMLDDMGRPVQTAKTNVMMDFFNIQGEFKAISNKFIENSRFKSLIKSNTAFALSHIGEQYMHGTLMYSILDNIKIMNKDNKFIDKDGNVTTQAKAMTLHEAIEVDSKGNMSLNKHAFKTNFGNSQLSLDLKKGKGLLEVKNLINKLAHDLHGNYNEEIQNMAQRHVAGKAIFMLRKWMVPGFNRRWRGAVNAHQPYDELIRDDKMFYSEDLQSFQEGYYVTGYRFFRKLAQDLRQSEFEGLAANWNKLSDMERANMRRFFIETATLAITLALSYILLNLASDIEDETEREAMFYATYLTRRMYSELQFYSNPVEALKIMSTPAASMSFIKKLHSFVTQLGTDAVNGEFELYERGRYKDTTKLGKRFTDLVPIASQVNRDIEESTSWLYNIY